MALDWGQERERHEQQVQPYRYFPGRGLRATTTKTPARLRFWAYAPPRPWVLGLAVLAVLAVTGWQLWFSADGGRAAGYARWIALVLVLLLLATTRITVSNHGLSFDVAGVRRVSCFGFIPLRAITDVAVGGRPQQWPAGRRSSSWLPGGAAVDVLIRQPDGAPGGRRVWVRDPERLAEALLGHPLRR